MRTRERRSGPTPARLTARSDADPSPTCRSPTPAAESGPADGAARARGRARPRRAASQRGGGAAAPSPGGLRHRRRLLPADGNGGIDVLHYDVHDRYFFGSGRLSGGPRLKIRATADLSRFNLDLLLPVDAVSVDGRPGGFYEARATRAADHPGRADRGRSVFSVRGALRAASPAAISYERRAQLARRPRRGGHHERAAHGAVVVPGQRPPERQGDVSTSTSPCPRTAR